MTLVDNSFLLLVCLLTCVDVLVKIVLYFLHGRLTRRRIAFIDKISFFNIPAKQDGFGPFLVDYHCCLFY